MGTGKKKARFLVDNVFPVTVQEKGSVNPFPFWYVKNFGAKHTI